MNNDKKKYLGMCPNCGEVTLKKNESRIRFCVNVECGWTQDSNRAKSQRNKTKKLSYKQKLSKQRVRFLEQINGNVRIRALDPIRELATGLYLGTWNFPEKTSAKNFIVEFKDPQLVVTVIKVIKDAIKTEMVKMA